MSTKKTYAASLFLLAVGVVCGAWFSKDANSFPAASGQANYVGGVSCTINFTTDRTYDEMANDFKHCQQKHEQFIMLYGMTK